MPEQHEDGPLIGVVGMGALGRAVTAACAEAGSPVVLTASRIAGWRVRAVPEVMVDASAPDAQDDVYEYCLAHQVALVECVSNLGHDHWDRLGELARHVPVIRATNLSVGHHIQLKILRHLASLPVPSAVPSVAERHPATKAHRPSATAVALADAWTRITGEQVPEVSSQRCGMPVSEHEFQLTLAAETLTVRHAVGSLQAAAMGALTAAHWVWARRPGLVTMHAVYDDILGDDREQKPCPSYLPSPTR